MRTVGVDTLNVESPAQAVGDSTVRERFLSTRPDTLNLPSLRGYSLIPQLDSLQKCYTIGFFAENPLLHPELVANPPGYNVELRPYEPRNDEWITGTLLFCFLFTVFFVRQIWHFLRLRTKEFFHVATSETADVHEVRTTLENRYGLCMGIILCLMYTIAFYAYTLHYNGVFLGSLSPYALLGYYMAAFLSYFSLRYILYVFVNCIFFDKKTRAQWRNAYSYLIFLETILLFPVLMIYVYFNISEGESIYFILFLFFFPKTILLFKTYGILFKKSYCLLHFFVYFCALEIIPVVLIWTTLTRILNSLIAIF